MFAIAVADAVLYYHATGTLGRLDIVLATAIVIAQWAVERRKVDPNPDAIFATIALLLLTSFGG
ncbi:MAG: hypothetical protein HC927_08660 [Deltaproteobacteria bacterium]|nr:hypothetical protein [Deltaproteobacteria bacterium]